MNLEPIQIELENFFDVIIVGGGTCGLAVAARLCENCPGSIFTEDEHQRFHWLKQRGHKVNLLDKPGYSNCASFKSSDILVLDLMDNKFCSQWEQQFKSCQIPYLRSPMFFHLDPVTIDGMYNFSFLNNRQNELMEITNVVGKEFSKHQQKRIKRKKSNRIDDKTHDANGIVDINMRDWRDYYRPSTKLFHDYNEEIVTRYNLQNCVRQDEVSYIEYKLLQSGENIGKGLVITTKSGKQYGCKIGIVSTGHFGDINYPIKPFNNTKNTCHTTHLFQNKVKFLDDHYFKNRKSKNIVIVGGGLTSAQLAHVACQDPTVKSVTLLFRSPIKIKHFDFHLDWVTKYKNVKKSAFYIKDTDEERYEMLINAREGGSINPEYYKKLNKHVKSGKLKWLTSTSIVEQAFDETYELALNSGDKLSNVDFIYFATGIRANVNSLKFLQPILNEQKIDIVEGYPCLTDNLQWNEEVPLFMTGKNASLKIGPTSANLDGARTAAERIGWYLQDLKQRGELNWSGVETSTNNSSIFDTQLKLASGQLNWFTLLDTA
ncbi:unnamed protein product [Candida verbasci]|uniref:L-ornithine N(5)-monooxygenase n=1 Tax=Candida verbasci TaxID=1227364 RepID=A0A9W4TSB6_9ASCO|nr:unnamed protein product [Candida verbasci]